MITKVVLIKEADEKRSVIPQTASSFCKIRKIQARLLILKLPARLNSVHGKIVSFSEYYVSKFNVFKVLYLYISLLSLCIYCYSIACSLQTLHNCLLELLLLMVMNHCFVLQRFCIT